MMTILAPELTGFTGGGVELAVMIVTLCWTWGAAE
jgi:hypothetical protein